MKTFTKIIAILALGAMASFGQTILSTTTLGAAITTLNGTTVQLAATTGMASAGPANQINSVLYVDKEFMWVQTLVDSTHVIVQRAKGAGASARPATHLNGATVWYANTANQGTTFVVNAARYFANGSPGFSEVSGTCTAASELALPVIYLFTGHRYTCMGAATAGQWVEVDAPGQPVLGATYTVPAGAIVPPGTIFYTDTGTAAATSITVPAGVIAGFQITIIPGGVFTWTTAGNIALAGSAVVNKALTFTWSGTKWIPSYIA